MLYQPTWFHRLDEILKTLRGMESSHLDRQAVRKLLGGAERRGRQIMAGLASLRARNAFAASRRALIARLEETAAGALVRWEVNRPARVVDDLDRTCRQLAARRVRIPAAANVGERRLRDPGELRIEFFGAEDLADKLFEVSQAVANDWSAFERTVEGEAQPAESIRNLCAA